MRVQAVIYCDAPVALPTHRLIATAFDASMVMIAVGVFLGIFFFSGSLYVLAATNLLWLGAITPIGGVCFLIGWGWLLLKPSRQ